MFGALSKALKTKWSPSTNDEWRPLRCWGHVGHESHDRADAHAGVAIGHRPRRIIFAYPNGVCFWQTHDHGYDSTPLWYSFGAPRVIRFEDFA